MKTLILALLLFCIPTSAWSGTSTGSVNGVEVPPLNILFFAIDDFSTSNLDGWGGGLESDIEDPANTYGHALTREELPNIYRFIDSGVSYKQHRAAPSCVLARASLWTGLSQLNLEGSEAGFDLSESPGGGTAVRLAEEAGYNTIGVGKFGMTGDQTGTYGRTTDTSVAYGWGFNQAGFAPLGSVMHLYGWGAYGDSKYNYVENDGDTQTSDTDDDVFLVKRDADYLISKSIASGTPFFAYFGFNWPHLYVYNPGPVPGENPTKWSGWPNTTNVCPEDTATWTKCFTATMKWLDYYIGFVYDSLPDEVRKRTLVVIWSDNGSLYYFQGTDGEVAGPYPSGYSGTITDASNGKFSLFDGGIQTPLIISGGGVHVSKRGTVSNLAVSTADLAVTLASVGIGGQLATADLSSTGYDGVDISSTFNHRTAPTNSTGSYQVIGQYRHETMSDASLRWNRTGGISVTWQDPSTGTIWKMKRLPGNCMEPDNTSGTQDNGGRYNANWVNTVAECSDTLFNITTDPLEATDVRSSNTSTYAQLLSHLTSNYTLDSDPCTGTSFDGGDVGTYWAEPTSDLCS